jgi:hypothetical protein
VKYLSGEHGPVFVGFGDVPKLSFWRRWGATVAIAAGLFAGSLLFMVVL